MCRLLLLGAGFSRNWGGWLASEVFEYLLGCPEIISNARVRTLLWESQPNGGFEEALANLQHEHQGSNFSSDFLVLESAVHGMFDQMNRKLIDVVDPLRHEPDEYQRIRNFLSRFDAIFTLNQDVLLEAMYMGISLASSSCWQEAYVPGMTVVQTSRDASVDTLIATYEPSDRKDAEPHRQPIFKLHGSSNWKERGGGSMLILGGKKARTIGNSPVLGWYAKEFTRYLSKLGARLMIIGYGFRDEHINGQIIAAVRKGLQIFVISPSGTGVVQELCEGKPLISHEQKELEAMFKQGLVGASRRQLRDVLRNDEVERAKYDRFLDGLTAAKQNA